jgi:hypothetical protein
MATVFADGLPARITVADFKRAYLAAFPRFTDPLNDTILEVAIAAVYDMFDGVARLWQSRDDDAWYNKTTRCYTLLTAWYITNLYPRLAAGIQSTGGMPVLSKKIGDVSIHYMDTSRLSTTDEVLQSLRSNPYGSMALMMIRSAPKRFAMRLVGHTQEHGGSYGR